MDAILNMSGPAMSNRSQLKAKEMEQTRKGRKVKRRIAQKIQRTGKPDLRRIPGDIGAASTLREARKTHDAVTTAINGWLRA